MSTQACGKEVIVYLGYLENDQESSNFYDFRWSTASKLPSDIQDWQIINHFPEISHISTKLKFSQHLKSFKTVPCDTFYPRAYHVHGPDSFTEFDFDYKATYVQSLLKSFLLGEPVSLEKVAVGIRVCRKRIERGSVLDCIQDFQWKLLKSITPEVTARLYEEGVGGPVQERNDLMREAGEVLEILKIQCPQYHLDGEKNVWIAKPGGKSRGRDIFLHNGLEELKRRISIKQSWIIQKYIENPLLIRNRKFDIRQWVLITSISPLTIWFYEDCYLRFSAEDYDIDRLDNKFVHLTNNSIVKYSDQFAASEFDGCMWAWTQFRDYLLSISGQDDYTQKVLPRMKEIVISAVQSVQGFLQPRTHSFELLGFDLMVDRDLKPWLLEVNTSPAMDYSTGVTEILVKRVLEDTLKVVLDKVLTPSADTGRFSLLYQEGETSRIPA